MKKLVGRSLNSLRAKLMKDTFISPESSKAFFTDNKRCANFKVRMQELLVLHSTFNLQDSCILVK